MEREAYFRHAPTTLEPREGVAVGVETVTPGCIEEIVINDAARWFLPESLRYLATADFLKSLIRISVPTRKSPIRVLTPGSWGRAVPLGYGVIPFEHALGRVVSGKGAWLSGALLDERKKLVLDARYSFYGLLSTDGATEDTKLSSEFIEAGFRSALHLGYAVLRENPFKAWVYQRWRQTDFGKIAKEMFTNLAERGYGRPAYLFRVGATLERQVDELSKGAPNRLKKETSIAARLMLAEAKMPRSQIAQAFAKIGEQQEPALSALHTLGLGQALPEDETTGYAHLLAALYARNVVALRRVRWNGKIPLGEKLGQRKDIDLGHFSYDFDESIPNPTDTPDITDSVSKYTQTAGTTLADYFGKILIECRYGHGYSRILFSLGEERIALNNLRDLDYHFISLLKHYAGDDNG